MTLTLSPAAVGSHLRTLVLCHLDLEMPGTALHIRPFPLVSTLIIRHCSIPKRDPLPPTDNILPLGTLITTPSLRTLHIHSGRSRGAITIDDFASSFHNRLLRLSLCTYERPPPLHLEQFSSITTFEFWWPGPKGAPPLSNLPRNNSIRELSVRDDWLEKTGVDECDNWSDVGSDLEDFDVDFVRTEDRGTRDRFTVVVRGLVECLGASPACLPALRSLVLPRKLERVKEEGEGQKREMGHLETLLADLDVQLRFEERTWASESAGEGFVYPLERKAT